MPRSVFTDAYSVLRTALISARKEAGLTQAELSARVGKPQPFVSKIERGVRRIDVVEFCAVAQALGHDPVKLFTSISRKLPRRLDI